MAIQWFLNVYYLMWHCIWHWKTLPEVDARAQGTNGHKPPPTVQTLTTSNVVGKHWKHSYCMGLGYIVRLCAIFYLESHRLTSTQKRKQKKERIKNSGWWQTLMYHTYTLYVLLCILNKKKEKRNATNTSRDFNMYHYRCVSLLNYM